MQTSIQKPVIIFLFCLSFFPLSAITVTWTGQGGNTKWDNPGNWDTGTIPGSGDDVIISAGAFVSYSLINPALKSVHIMPTSTLLIKSSSRLYIRSTDDWGLYNEGELLVSGTLRLRYLSNGNALINHGVIENDGLVEMENLKFDGLVNEGTFHNQTDGIIQIDDVDGFGIRDSGGNFLNEGQILFLNGSDTDGGMYLLNTNFENAPLGAIDFVGTHSGYIELSGGTLTNSGSINVNSDVPRRAYGIYLSTNAKLYNEAGGKIDLQYFYKSGIQLSGHNSLVKNSGTITVTNGEGNGIAQTSRCTLRNEADAYIFMEEIDYGFYLTYRLAVFENRGKVSCKYIRTAITNSGRVINFSGGDIVLKSNYEAIDNKLTGVFENFSEYLYTKNTTELTNYGVFTNWECAKWNLHGRLYNDGIVENYGWIYVPKSGSNFNANTLVENYGFIEDSYDRFDNALDNQGIRSTTLDNPQNGVPYANALDLVSLNDFIIPANWYVDYGLQTIGGTYNQQTNTFTPNANAIGVTSLYVNVENTVHNCFAKIKIPIDGQVLPVSKGDQLAITTYRQTDSNVSHSVVDIFPNPSNGIINLRLPKRTEGTLEIRLIDLNGRIVWQQQKIATNTLVLDATGQVATGIYSLQIWQKGDLLGQERLILQEK